MNKVSTNIKNVRKTLRQFISPAFVSLLVISAIFWYLTKLSYTYTAEIPVNVNVAGNKFKVQCLAEGTGYRIMAHRFFIRKYIYISADNVELTPSAGSMDSYVIKPFTLQNAISVRYADVKIISVGDIPEILLEN